MSTWIEDAPAATECRHEPNLRGTACQHCGIPAELVTPDELTDALMAEIVAIRVRDAGQTGWLDTCNSCDAIGPVHPVTGYCDECQE
jgi:hypothetical protein